ncbi:unnamed protein product [Adineta steineri]|uniref:DUF389 domain-containing protein n=1 Tax=Adineta steineri TaxID=433720 RepID=A0A818VBV7_9BILA|nr:unnamed protein product [Adineta steineri]
MSNDYALFMILLPNDLDKETTSPNIKPSASTPSMNAASTFITPASSTSRIDKDNEHFYETSTESLCITLKNYFSEKKSIEPIWMISDNKKTYQITFYVEFGLVSDRILQDLTRLGIGRRNNTKIFVLPTIITLEGQNESLPALSLIEDTTNSELLSSTIENKTTKIRKRINESNFKKSVRARLMVHQVVASIRASTALSFDFVLLICLASMLAAFGLLENSTVIIVASMLVSPLMNPILGIVFGLSVREHSLWKRGFRNELIGLIICITCGFIIGLFTTFAETKWGNSTSFPTSEMKSRGDIKRLWVGVLIALPSGAGVALSVLGGNTGSLVGVAISASLLPPAVNCGLLFAYALLGTLFSNIAAVVDYSSSLNNTKQEVYTDLNCTKYINNDYQSLYTCNLASEAAILAGCSLLLTIVNIICIIIMALFILRIKEVVPLHQPNKDITNFFHYDVKVARDYNKTIHANNLESNNLAITTITGNNLAQSIVNRWKTFKSHDNQTGQIPTISNDIELTDNNILNINTESHRKLLRLKTFAKEYNLDVFDKHDYDLLNSTSREKVHLLVNDLVDMCQEDIPSVFVDLFHLQPCTTQTSTNKEYQLFYQEIIELLPPKWYQLFVREQQKRQIKSWSSSFNRTYSLRLPQLTPLTKTISQSNENDHNLVIEKHKRAHFQRQSSVPESNLRSLSINQETEVPVHGTRFRITRPSIPTLTVENK